MLPEDLPLTAGELARLFDAAGLKTHQEIANAMGVGRSTVTKWLSGSLKLSPEAAARIRKMEPSPGAEVTWNTYLAGIPATISAFKERIASSEPKLQSGPAPEVDPKALAENLAPLLHVPRIEVVAQVPKQETGDLARELVAQMPKPDTRQIARELVAQMPKIEVGEFAREVAAHVCASSALAPPSPDAQLLDLARTLAEQLAHQAFKVVGTAQEEAERLVTTARWVLREALWNRARRVLREARQRARSVVQEAQGTAQGIVQEAQRTAQGIVQEAHRDAERITCQARWNVGKGYFQAVALIFGFLAIWHVPWTRIIPPREAAPPATNATRAPEQVAEQISGRMPPSPVQGLTTSISGGLKMPEKPDPTWLKPGKDGKCHDPKTGERVVAVVLRGSCWRVFASYPGDTTCREGLYDPPPEVVADPKMRIYRESCFEPFRLTSNAVSPR